MEQVLQEGIYTACISFQNPRPVQAGKAIRKLLSTSPVADCLSQTGDAARARSTLAESLSLAPGDINVAATAASVYEDLGERQAALRWLDAALRAGYSRAEVEHDPSFKRLCADPRYLKIGRSERQKGINK